MKKFRDGNSGDTMNDFPEELIREILLRLPVKSLLRFRSVSKSWLSLISDPFFAKSHFELAFNPTDRLILLTPSQTRSIDVNASFHDDSAVATLNFPLTASFHEIRIAGSCRGFLLLNGFENLFVWNPSTGSCKKLSYPLISQKSYPIGHGFGYDCSTDDYMIVLAYSQPDPDDFGFHFEFFSLKNNSWGKFEGTHLTHVEYDVEYSGIFVNGAIHWLAYGPDAQDNVDVIVVFDLAQKNVRQLPLPDFEHELEICNLEILGGCLSLSITKRYKTEIWVMKEYGLKSSWEKSIIVPIGETPTKFILPKCFTKADEIVGISIDGLMKLNHEGELLEHLKYADDTYLYGGVMYRECLLALPGDIKGGGEDMQTVMNKKDQGAKCSFQCSGPASG